MQLCSVAHFSVIKIRMGAISSAADCTCFIKLVINQDEFSNPLILQFLNLKYCKIDWAAITANAAAAAMFAVR